MSGKSPETLRMSGYHGDMKLDKSAIIKAVIIAFFVGLAIGAAVGFIGYGLAIAGILTEEIIDNSIVLHGFIICLGMFPNILCGYLAAVYAGRDELAHGIVAGIALLAISGLFYFFPDDDPFDWMDGIALLLEVPLAVIGAFIAKRTQ